MVRWVKIRDLLRRKCEPTNSQKIELNFGSLHEYRYGGEMIDGAPHFAMQSEERVHDFLVGNIDYSIDFNSGNSSLIKSQF